MTVPRTNYKTPQWLAQEISAATAMVLDTHGEDRQASRRLEIARKHDALLQSLYRWMDNQHQVIDEFGDHYETELLGSVAAIEQIFNSACNA